MKTTYEQNQQYIDAIQQRIGRMKLAEKLISEEIQKDMDELTRIQSENLIMAEEMKAGKNLD